MREEIPLLISSSQEPRKERKPEVCLSASQGGQKDSSGVHGQSPPEGDLPTPNRIMPFSLNCLSVSQCDTFWAIRAELCSFPYPAGMSASHVHQKFWVIPMNVVFILFIQPSNSRGTAQHLPLCEIRWMVYCSKIPGFGMRFRHTVSLDYSSTEFIENQDRQY